MEEEVELERRRRPRLRMIALLLLLLVMLLLVIAWTQREDIASRFVNRELQRRGVQASYEITRLSPWTQRLENVVIGDPRNPDLTARWVEIELSHGLRAPRVRKVTARGVRLMGRLVDGKVSLGQIDRLLPPPTGAPFSLPDLIVDVADTRIGLRTPAGNVGMAIEGVGNLSDGFDGRLALASRRLAVGSCAATVVRASLDLSVSERQPSIDGPLSARAFGCEDDLQLALPRARVEATLSRDLGDWIGNGTLVAARLRSSGHGAGPTEARFTFAGDVERTRGSLRVAAADASLAGIGVSRLALEGGYGLSMRAGTLVFEGDMAAREAAAGPPLLNSLRSSLDAFGGLPLEPIGQALADAAVRAGRAFDMQGRVRIETGPEGGGLSLSSLGLDSRSGLRVAVGGGEGLTYRWPDNRLGLAADLELSGGGFPTVRAQLERPATGSGVRGVARIAPFAAGNARLQVAPIYFVPGPGGRTSIRTAAVIDGPIAGGQVTGLAFPLAGWVGPQGFSFGESCMRARFDSFVLGQLRLNRTELPLCPNGRAIAWQQGNGSVRGGIRTAGITLAGQIGGSALSVAPRRFAFDIADSSFSADSVAIRLGSGDYLNRLDLGTLSGRFVEGGIAGRFSGGSGKIANVPLLISDASADWQLVGAAFAADGGLTVSDEADPSRFYPLRSDDFRLTLVDNRIEAQGWLEDPETGTRVTRASLVHALDTGTGRADLEVPGIRFGEGFQPEQLTRLTTGVVALVDGIVTGRGEIAWSPEGTSSTGTFSTPDLDLAAPFGPVKGLKTTIRFTDLLGLQTAPGQLAEVEEVQAGITVYDGRVQYQLLPDLRVRVESGHWPFAGGDLLLDETVLDFGKESAKHLTFRIVGMDAAAFVQQMEFKNIYATGTFDGVVPMRFDQSGGYIVNGRVAARPEGGVVSYIGELTDKELGAYGKLAFDALKSLRYDKLAVNLDGALDGEFIAAIELDGIAREAPGPGGIAGVALRQLAKIPFEFNITARGRFRALLAMMRSFEDPTPLLQSALARELGNVPLDSEDVQLEESEDVP